MSIHTKCSLAYQTLTLRLEAYSFSTGCQYFCSQVPEILVNLFESDITYKNSHT